MDTLIAHEKVSPHLKMFINQIETELSICQHEETIDSGYSDVSGESSPCPDSPLPSSPLLLYEQQQHFLFQQQKPEPVYVYFLPVDYLQYFVNNYHVEEPSVEFIKEEFLPVEPLPPVSSSPKSNNLVERLTKWNLPPPTIPAEPLPGWNPMPYGMEQFWQSAFAWFFRPFWAGPSSHTWTLQPVDQPPVSDEWPFHSVSYSAKVRFQCPYMHGWTSMKGRVVFWYRMRRQDDNIITEAYFKLYGQQCNRCYKHRQDFLAPLWYHEEIENAVRFLSMEVAKTYYGGEKLPMPRRLRQGNPNPAYHHDPNRCQACVEGLCVRRI